MCTVQVQGGGNEEAAFGGVFTHRSLLALAADHRRSRKAEGGEAVVAAPAITVYEGCWVFRPPREQDFGRKTDGGRVHVVANPPSPYMHSYVLWQMS